MAARIDIEKSAEWYSLQKEDLERDFLQEIEKTIHKIVLNPYQHYQILKNIRRANINRFPFSLFFSILGDEIKIFSVFHQSRNPLKWKEKLKDLNP